MTAEHVVIKVLKILGRQEFCRKFIFGLLIFISVWTNENILTPKMFKFGYMYKAVKVILLNLISTLIMKKKGHLERFFISVNILVHAVVEIIMKKCVDDLSAHNKICSAIA